MSNRRTPTTSRLAHDSIKGNKTEMYLNRSLDDILGEIWVDIIGYEGRYRVSNMGRVKSMSRTVNRCGNAFHTTRDMIKKQRLTKGGYLTVYLAIGKKYSHKLLNVLVGIHFLDNPYNKKEVNHLFGNKLDNRAISLDWATTSENKKHAYKIGLMCQKGENHASHKLNNTAVIHIFTSTFSSKSLSLIYKVRQSTINNIRSGASWSHITKKQYVKKKL